MGRQPPRGQVVIQREEIRAAESPTAIGSLLLFLHGSLDENRPITRGLMLQPSVKSHRRVSYVRVGTFSQYPTRIHFENMIKEVEGSRRQEAVDPNHPALGGYGPGSYYHLIGGSGVSYLLSEANLGLRNFLFRTSPA